eukprot:4715208-Alexandrium_andersonii.AAC.1
MSASLVGSEMCIRDRSATAINLSISARLNIPYVSCTSTCRVAFDEAVGARLLGRAWLAERAGEALRIARMLE